MGALASLRIYKSYLGGARSRRVAMAYNGNVNMFRVAESTESLTVRFGMYFTILTTDGSTFIQHSSLLDLNNIEKF